MDLREDDLDTCDSRLFLATCLTHALFMDGN